MTSFEDLREVLVNYPQDEIKCKWPGHPSPDFENIPDKRRKSYIIANLDWIIQLEEMKISEPHPDVFQNLFEAKNNYLGLILEAVKTVQAAN